MTRKENQQLVGDAGDIARQAEDMMEETAGRAEEAVHEVRGRLAAALEAAKTAYDRMEDKTVRTAKATDRCIRDHPWETAGVALGLGLLVGVLAARK